MVNKKQHIVNRNILLIQKGYTVPSLAKAIKYTRQSVHDAIYGKSTSYRCHRRIAIQLQMPLVEIWPELYGVVPKSIIYAQVNEINESMNAVNS